jgi:hypothetical protein
MRVPCPLVSMGGLWRFPMFARVLKGTLHADTRFSNNIESIWICSNLIQGIFEVCSNLMQKFKGL